ncbi:MAG: hypothetical protein KDC87_20650 [Planctomycetes bacterium]|nr:hypothetical protein [Planctomycetota bacterium]
MAAVEAGTGLLVMLGPRCDPDSYNTHLYRNGEGPLGIALRRHEGFDPGGQRYYRSQVVDLEHPVFHDFKEDESLLQYLQLAGIYRYFTTDRETLAKNHAVLWQISNPSLSPLLVGGRFGEGRTLLLTSAITAQPKKWNTLDAQIHSIPLFHPLAHWLSHPATDPYNVLVGGSLSAVVPKRPQGMAVVLCDRAGSSKVPVAQDAKPLRGNLFALPPFTQTNFAGFYTFEMEQGESGTAQQLRLPFAVNPDPTEGELGYLAHAVVRERLGIQRIHTALPDDSAPIETAGIGEIGPFLLYLVLLLVVGEACWARFVSRRRT